MSLATLKQKVGQLIDKVAYELKALECTTNANGLFKNAKTFTTKAVVNLPNATTVYQAFSYWNTEPIPIVEELTVNAPKILVENNQACMGQMFIYNNGVKKVILNMPDECKYMEATFSQAKKIEVIVLNFSTKNIINYNNTFHGSTVKRIIGVLDFSSTTSATNIFSLCNHLEEVTFEPNTLSISMSLANCINLTSESIQSIIDGLATVETAQTLTLHADVKAKLTESQIAQITSKNWNLA